MLASTNIEMYCGIGTKANWEVYEKQKAAEAILYDKEKEADAQRAMAEERNLYNYRVCLYSYLIKRK